MANNLEYIEESHTYLWKGKIIPSVSKIVAWKYDLYKDVPVEILRRKAEYGTKVHDLCEKIMSKEITLDTLPTEDNNVISACYDFKMLMNKMCFFPKSMEQMITYKGHYGGHYDILTEDDILIDIKTTAQLHVDNIGKDAPLNLQLSLYALATGVSDAYYLWLPKGKKAKCERVSLWDKEDLLNLIKDYEKHNSNEE